MALTLSDSGFEEPFLLTQIGTSHVSITKLQKTATIRFFGAAGSATISMTKRLICRCRAKGHSGARRTIVRDFRQVIRRFCVQPWSITSAGAISDRVSALWEIPISHLSNSVV